MPIVMSHDLLSHGFSHPYQIVFTLFNIGIEFTRVNGVDSYTFQLINPNFRVGQLSDFAKNKVVFFVHFEWKYIISIFCWLLLSSTVWPLAGLLRVRGSFSLAASACKKCRRTTCWTSGKIMSPRDHIVAVGARFNRDRPSHWHHEPNLIAAWPIRTSQCLGYRSSQDRSSFSPSSSPGIEVEIRWSVRTISYSLCLTPDLRWYMGFLAELDPCHRILRSYSLLHIGFLHQCSRWCSDAQRRLQEGDAIEHDCTSSDVMSWN